MADFWEQALEGFVHILPPEVREIAELVSTPVPPTPGRRIPAPGEPAATRLNAIDHIVVVMLENRSFDHMLGYLSLPPEQGGKGRVTVDGLVGPARDVNTYQGGSYPI